MSKPKISIIIPVWNAEKYLHRCLNSVCGQTLRDIEILCINDASTDNSKSILEEYAGKDSRIQVVNLKTNSGESVARNSALAIAQGEYIGSVDNDDAIDLDFFEKLYDKALETDADIVKGNCIVRYDNDHLDIQNINDKVRIHKAYFQYQWWTAIYRTSMILNNNIMFPANLCIGADIVFLAYAIKNCRIIATVDNVLYHYYRRNDSNDSKIFNIDKLKSVLEAYKIVFEEINNQYNSLLPDDVYENILYRICYTVHSIHYKNKTELAKRCCALLLYEMYISCKKRDIFDVRFRNELPESYKLISRGDIDGLVKFFMLHHTPNKLRFANLFAALRMKISPAICK